MPSDDDRQDLRDGDRIERDKLGRPYIIDPDGKRVTYTRISTYAKALSDGDALSWWRMTKMAFGLAVDPSILSMWRAGMDEVEDKEVLGQIIARASETGGANEAANWGTTLHSLADIIDFSDEPLTRDRWDLESSIWDALDAYVELTASMTMLSREQFVVEDTFRCAGSYDRTIQWGVSSVVGDLKTGAIRFPDHGIQVALYAHGKHYDYLTGTRVPGPVDSTSKEVGLIVHLPRPGVKDRNGRVVTPSLVPVDLVEGWKLAHLAEQVRAARRAKLALPLAEESK